MTASAMEKWIINNTKLGKLSELKSGKSWEGCPTSGDPRLRRCEKFKIGEIYCPQVKLSTCHKNKIVLERIVF